MQYEPLWHGTYTLKVQQFAICRGRNSSWGAEESWQGDIPNGTSGYDAYNRTDGVNVWFPWEQAEFYPSHEPISYQSAFVSVCFYISTEHR